MSDFEDDDEPPRHGEGSLIVQRYRLVRVLGSGSFGEVWEAVDIHTGRAVAVKLLFSHVGLPHARAQLEVAALRQALPGVVELLDDGSEGEQAFLVFERVPGSHFPGIAPPCSWEDIAPVVVSLLETLGRVHAAFIVHRDLKPANVLVTPDRQVRLLDFGTAYRVSAGAQESIDKTEVLGTALYMAPEQILLQPITERTDLYALGVMLYEALAGRLPHEGKTPGLVLHARLKKPHVPLEVAAPGVPPHIARLVDRMLSLSPADRPASAFEVLSSLRGEKAMEDAAFLWLGSRAGFDSVVSAVRKGQSVDIVGPRGSGRTRWLEGVRELTSGSRRVHWIKPLPRGERAPLPFEGLTPMLGEAMSAGADGSPAMEPPVTEAAALARVRAALEAGDVLLADDFARLDPGSQRVIASARPFGAVVRALEAPPEDGGDVVHVQPLGEADLRSLFAGPDRLLHLQEDAARLLHQRTMGLPARVVREVTTWLRLGIARRSLNFLIVSRDALDRLAAGVLPMSPPADDSDALRDLPERALDVLVWTSLAWPHTEPALLQEASQLPAAELDSALATLLARGLVRSLPDGRVAPLVALERGPWSEARLRAAHAAIAGALPPSASRRILHLILAGATRPEARLAIAREAAALAERLIPLGRLGTAVASIEGGLRAVRDMGPLAEKERAVLFRLWAEAAFEEDTPRAADPLLSALYRADPWPERPVIETLARALKVEEHTSPRALDLAREVPPQADSRLERLRVLVLLQAARLQRDEAMEERLHDELASSAAAADPEVAARIDHMRGRLRYQQSRFLEAAALQERAALTGPALHRIAAKNAGAWALMEAFELDRALDLASEALALATEHRHAVHEAAAIWAIRTIAFRKGVSQTPDLHLATAAEFLARRHWQGSILFAEAVIAFRAGHPEALALARRSHDLFAAIDQQRGALLMRCLLVALGQRAEPSELEALHRKALALKGSGLSLQALALLAMGGQFLSAAVPEDEIGSLAREVPEQHWGSPTDILSVNESLEAIRKAPCA
jgi:hypothetical protein